MQWPSKKDICFYTCVCIDLITRNVLFVLIFTFVILELSKFSFNNDIIRAYETRQIIQFQEEINWFVLSDFG